MQGFMREVVARAERNIVGLLRSDLIMPHIKFVLLANSQKYCLGFHVRAMPPEATIPTVPHFDQELQETLRQLLDADELSNMAQYLLSAPSRHGGLGFRTVSSTISQAYIAAAVQASELTEPILSNVQNDKKQDVFVLRQRRICHENLQKHLTTTSAEHADAKLGDDHWRDLPYNPHN